MRERGVVVSFNSDSSDLARRLNFEAAKAVKYGGMPREEALELRHVNPAKQLGIEKRVGSLEAGKDADFVVWSGDPLATLLDRPGDLDRRQEVLRPRGRPLAPSRPREGTGGSRREGEEDARDRAVRARPGAGGGSRQDRPGGEGPGAPAGSAAKPTGRSSGPTVR